MKKLLSTLWSFLTSGWGVRKFEKSAALPQQTWDELDSFAREIELKFGPRKSRSL